jgi:copper homeostasis protein
MAKRVLLEICIASVDDALAAEQGGADRLEVNSALTLGGLTPSIGLFAEIRKHTSLPLIAMLRPRPSGFCYSDADLDVMLADARELLAAGADGLAFGILTARSEVDTFRCRRLIEACGNRQAIFHRAFDHTPEPFEALDALIELGFHRVMSSGQDESALNGSELLAELIRRAGDRIEVLPAGGIRPENVEHLIRATGCNQVHASLRQGRMDTTALTRPRIVIGSVGIGEDRFDATDIGRVAEMREKLR